MFNLLVSAIVAAVISFGAPYFQHQATPLVGSTFSPTGGGTYRLGQSIGTSNATIKLASFTEPVSNIPYTMSYLGSGIEYGTLSPQSSISEFVSFTGITQNADGTATLTGVLRGLSRSPAGSGCTASSTLAQAHAGQSIFILSDSPCLFAQYAVKSNNETIAGLWTFSQPPVGINPGGSPNATASVNGLVQLATAAQAASSTVTGSTGALLVVPTSIATSSNDVAGLHVVVTQNNGKINWNQIDLATAFTISGGFIDTASSTFTSTTQFAATSSLLAFTSSSVSTSTIAGNLTIAENASTTNMVISGTCSGCVNPTIVSQSLGNLNGGSPSVASASASCTGIQKVSGCGLNANANSGNGIEPSVYPSSATACTGTVYGGGGNSGASGATVYAICVNP
jgi:hypothetical protein